MNPKSEIERTDAPLEQQAASVVKAQFGMTLVVFGFAGVFGLVFFLIGVTGGGTDSAILSRIATLIGLAIMAVSGFFINSQRPTPERRARVLDKLQRGKANPGQPWLWRADWARGEIPEAAGERLLVAWSQILIPGFLVVLLVSVAPEIDFDTQWRNYEHLGGMRIGIVIAVLIPLLIGLWISVRHALTIARKRKFQSGSLLCTDEMPFHLGGLLKGRVKTTLTDIPDADMSVKLFNVRIADASADSKKNNRRKVLWQTEQAVSRDHFVLSRDGVTAPVEFEIPSDAIPSGRINPSATVRWELKVRIPLKGLDYDVMFLPPIFDIGEDGRIREGSPKFTV